MHHNRRLIRRGIFKSRFGHLCSSRHTLTQLAHKQLDHSKEMISALLFTCDFQRTFALSKLEILMLTRPLKARFDNGL